MKTAQLVVFVCLSVLLAVSTAVANDKSGKGKKHATESASPGETAKPGGSEAAVQVKWGFSDEEKQVVRGYVGSYGENEGRHGKRLPPGLAKKVARGGQLPPGWREKCVVGEVMPAPVYEQCHALPPELVVKLPAPPEPTLTVTIGGKVVRLLKATREILDVFDVNVKL